ncbi:MAG: hypothetical protein RLZZ262_66 [Bacteroidota bacterium]|jgi:hypothetical protein
MMKLCIQCYEIIIKEKQDIKYFEFNGFLMLSQKTI